MPVHVNLDLANKALTNAPWVLHLMDQAHLVYEVHAVVTSMNTGSNQRQNTSDIGVGIEF